jgi:hypothetical protein
MELVIGRRKIILKDTSWKWDRTAWTGLIWLEISIPSELL